MDAMEEMLTHKKFINQLMESLRTDSRPADAVGYREGREVILCPEPLTFLKETDRFSSDLEKCRSVFENLARSGKRGFRKMKLEPNRYLDRFGFWPHSTVNGINLRPGVDDSSGKPAAVPMGDGAVHGLMAGQTGSGKSTLLNNLIFNLMAEYPPWELDLYLADFKRVEFSRYMNNAGYTAPHVCACAATGEVRYVMTLIRHLVDCMNARETFFSRIGTDKIANFRRMYPDIVLPRILLIVDEFQQLFLESSSRENESIRQMMTAIVKKGRATGVHILFASQEISQTLSRSVLGNFRLRIALNCNAGVSMDVLGNRAAAYIQPKKEALINVSDGTEKTNRKFTVPLIETEKPGNEDGVPYFNDYLESIYQLSEMYGFSKPQKFYQEDEQPEWETLEYIVGRIEDYRKEIFQGETGKKYFEVLTLGPYVTYSNLKYDYQSLFLEFGSRKTILAVSPRAEDLAYLQKLLAFNFSTSPKEKVTGAGYVHRIYSFQPVVQSLFSLDQELGASDVHYNPEDLDALQTDFQRTRMLYQLCREAATPLDFVLKNIRMNLDANRRNCPAAEMEKIEESLTAAATAEYGGILVEEIPEKTDRILSGSATPMEKQIARNLRTFHKFRKNPAAAFEPTVYWICGMEAVERIPEWMYSMMKVSLDYNILFILMASSEFDQMAQVMKFCDYLFVGGTNRRIYERLNVNYTNREADSIALDLTIRSMEEERSFKKFRCGFDQGERPSIPFEKYLD